MYRYNNSFQHIILLYITLELTRLRTTPLLRIINLLLYTVVVLQINNYLRHYLIIISY